MGAIDSFFSSVASWFGYVGSCALSPEATCRPFLAFLALGVSAAAALALLLIAYRRASDRPVIIRPTAARERVAGPRPRRVVEPRLVRTPAVHGGLRPAA